MPDQASGHRRAPRRVLVGVDLGKVTTSLAWAEVGEGGHLGPITTHAERHLGEPLWPFLELYRRLGAASVARVAATGAYSDRLTPPVLGGLPEEIAQELAAAALSGDGALNVVRIGGSGYSVLTRDTDGRVRYEANERCSAGTGETVEGLCGRLGCSLQEAIALAEASPDGVAVTSRCAVFAKSELTHFANQGEPHGRLFRGVFESVARNVHSLYDKEKVDGPVLVVGHGALIAPVVQAFARLAGAPVAVPPEAGAFEALGALRYAATRPWPTDATWPADPAALVRGSRRRIRSLTPAAQGPGSVTQLEAPATQTTGDSTTLVLGLDLGSTGSKAALLDAASGAVVTDVYRRTDGNPVEAAQALVAEIVREAGCAEVAAVGLTGSGRDAAATVFRAAYRELGARLVVENEIVAHATAAVRFDPDGGRSLSIVEIGGQDAKYISIAGGHVLESDMNRVCSAGTGSFLEEQAVAHGLDDIARFGELAARSVDPPDLGQTCTVFVADVAAEALADGYTRDDIFAGLQFSVIRNYRNRVMGSRQFQERVFFQGKPAGNASLARTLAAVTGREVFVPPDPGAMGAIGIAMLAAEALGAAGQAVADADAGSDAVSGSLTVAGASFDLRRVLAACVTERRHMRCRDKHCANLCRLEAASVDVAGERTKVVSGGNCPKYDDVSGGGRQLPKDAPNPYREREELLAGLLAEDEPQDSGGEAVAGASGTTASRAAVRVAIPYAHYLVDYLPFFHAFFARLGADVEVLRPGSETLAEGDRRCAAAGSCAPVKLLHGLANAEADWLFLPKFVHAPYPNAGSGTYTCPMAQGAPEMVEHALAAEGAAVKVLRPVLLRRDHVDLRAEEFVDELRRVAETFAAGRGAAATFRAAYEAALARQRRFEDGLRAIGSRALAWARSQRRPVVLVAGETHVLHEPIINSGIQELVAASGAVPLPADCYPLPPGVPPLARLHWASAGSALRAAVAAAQAGGTYPLLLCAHGCGPNSFVEHLFNHLLEDYPHTVLESDGHGGKAGYVTRVQAFLHTVHAYEAERAGGPPAAAGGRAAGPIDARRLARYDTPLPSSLDRDRYRRFYFGHVGGSLGRQLAAAMRGSGLDAHYAGPPDELALEEAGRHCTGKECLPYQLIWGSFARFLQAEPGGAGGGASDGPGRTLFLSAGNGFQACRANCFPLVEQIALDKLGLGERIEVGDLGLVTGSVKMMPVAWSALVAVDLLNMMRFHHLATERTRGDADALFARHSDRLARLLERPRPDGGLARGAAAARRTLREVEVLVAQAAADFGGLPCDRSREAELRDVFLCGDFYLRVDEWGNDGLQRKLSDLGLRLLFEPFGEFLELLVLRDVREAPARSRAAVERRATLRVMRHVIDRLVRAVQVHEPWVFWHDIRSVDAESRALLDGYPFGESIPTIGSALLTWRTKPVDGVVVVAPRGCGPALVAEAQLRRQAAAGPPLLFVYNDGDPIDEDRLAGFAWRLRSREPRRLA